jgi:hypothetical protein
MGRDDQPQRLSEGSQLREALPAETLDGRHQRTRTSLYVGDEENTSLSELEDSSVSFVRHWGRQYRWTFVAPKPGVADGEPLVGSVPEPVQGLAGKKRACGTPADEVFTILIRLVAAWVLVNGLFMAPLWVSAAVWDTPAPWFSVEAALIAVGTVLALPVRSWSRLATWLLATGIVIVAGAGFVDLVFQQSLGRPLNLALDLYLVEAVYRLAIGNTGPVRTLVGFVLIAASSALAIYATARLLAPTSGSADEPRRRLAAKLGAGIVGGTLALGLLGIALPALGQRVAAPAASLVVAQTSLLRATRAERVAFAADLANEPRAFADLPNLFSALDGRNVVVAYLESYGMAALDDPELASVVGPRLEAAAARLDSAGLHVATGRLVSPTTGGQSWYAHGTMISGLWLENQLRYELLLTSERETLVDDFHRAGYRTATVMPAITTAWPEAVRLGYDDIHTAQNIPYAGPPFYWVTMPDQFTWSFLGSVLREATTPLFVEVGMVSSHAPWTPVVPLVAWDAIGDGSSFEPYRLGGYPPEEIWWDVPALREGYAHSLAYSLDAMAGFAERFLDERTLLIVAGDHQAAPWVTGATDSDVPVHVIARDPALLDPFRAWGFRVGAFPPPGPVHRMDEFRTWFVRAFSGA